MLEDFEDLIPQGALPLMGFKLAAYYNSDGDLAYQISAEQQDSGSLPVALFLGMLEMVKHEFLTANKIASSNDDDYDY